MSETVIAPGSIPLDARIADWGSAIDDRDNFTKHQGHKYFPRMPQPLTGQDKQIADEVASLEQKVKEEKRSEKLSRMSDHEKTLFLLKEEQEQRLIAADAKVEKELAALKWNEKYGSKIAELKSIRKELAESGNGWKVSEIIKVDDTIKQLSAVGSDESVNAKMYQTVTDYFHAKQSEIETQFKARIFGEQNKLDALLKRGVPSAEPDAPLPEYQAIREQADALRAEGKRSEAFDLVDQFLKSKATKDETPAQE